MEKASGSLLKLLTPMAAYLETLQDHSNVVSSVLTSDNHLPFSSRLRGLPESPPRVPNAGSAWPVVQMWISLDIVRVRT